MTDRYNAFIVVLDRNIRSDDAEPLINAIRMIKGVISVEPNVADMDSHIAYVGAKSDLTKRLWKALEVGKE